MSAVSCLVIDGEMTIHRAAELKPVLLDVLRTPAATVELDLSNVTEIDSSGIQLLLLLQNAARTEQRALHLRAVSEPVQHVLSVLGLQGQFTATPVVAGT